MSKAIDALFGQHTRRAWASQLNGVTYATSWAVYAGQTPDGLHVLDFFTEVDPTALGAGGSLIYMMAHLECTSELRAVVYRTNTRGLRGEVRFTPETIEVDSPQIKRSVPRGEAIWLSENHIDGLDVLFLTHAHHSGALAGGVATFQSFFLNQLLVVPYRLDEMDAEAPEGHRWYRSSFKEEILLDAQGCLVQHRQPEAGASLEPILPAPELPDWRHEPLYANVKLKRYTPPSNASFALDDEITIDGPAVPIGAALTVPAGEGPFPAVLFLGGSGRHNRHGIVGEIGGMYHEVVDYLAEHGIAGLRYDKRGAGRTPAGPDPLLENGLATVVEDAVAAYDYLASRPEVDAHRIVLIGHSQGGKIALVLNTREGRPAAGVALLAAGGRPFDEVILAQAAEMSAQTGLTDEQRDARLKETREYLELVRSGSSFSAGDVPDILVAQSRSVPFVRDHMRFDLQTMLAQAQGPVAIFHGDRDFQVSSSEAEFLAHSAPEGVEVALHILPGLDHGFAAGEGESTFASYWDDRSVDPAFLASLLTWIRGVVA